MGLILRLIRGDGNNILVSLASALLGAAWSLATFFVIPVIAVDDLGRLYRLNGRGISLNRPGVRRLSARFFWDLSLFGTAPVFGRGACPGGGSG